MSHFQNVLEISIYRYSLINYLVEVNHGNQKILSHTNIILSHAIFHSFQLSVMCPIILTFKVIFPTFAFIGIIKNVIVYSLAILLAIQSNK